MDDDNRAVTAHRVQSILNDKSLIKCSVESRPEIVCLCGSNRFYVDYDKESLRLTLEGKIVLSLGTHTKCDADIGITEQQTEMLMWLHRWKIRLADKVHIINKDGYIGESTRSEIEYAESLGKPVTYMERG